jgi:hypothetical protein
MTTNSLPIVCLALIADKLSAGTDALYLPRDVLEDVAVLASAQHAPELIDLTTVPLEPPHQRCLLTTDVQSRLCIRNAFDAHGPLMQWMMNNDAIHLSSADIRRLVRIAFNGDVNAWCLAQVRSWLPENAPAWLEDAIARLAKRMVGKLAALENPASYQPLQPSKQAREFINWVALAVRSGVVPQQQLPYHELVMQDLVPFLHTGRVPLAFIKMMVADDSYVRLELITRAMTIAGADRDTATDAVDRLLAGLNKAEKRGPDQPPIYSNSSVNTLSQLEDIVELIVAYKVPLMDADCSSDPFEAILAFVQCDTDELLQDLIIGMLEKQGCFVEEQYDAMFDDCELNSIGFCWEALQVGHRLGLRVEVDDSCEHVRACCRHVQNNHDQQEPPTEWFTIPLAWRALWRPDEFAYNNDDGEEDMCATFDFTEEGDAKDMLEILQRADQLKARLANRGALADFGDRPESRLARRYVMEGLCDAAHHDVDDLVDDIADAPFFADSTSYLLYMRNLHDYLGGSVEERSLVAKRAAVAEASRRRHASPTDASVWAAMPPRWVRRLREDPVAFYAARQRVEEARRRWVHSIESGVPLVEYCAGCGDRLWDGDVGSGMYCFCCRDDYSRDQLRGLEFD